jgi:hypothetical protein
VIRKLREADRLLGEQLLENQALKEMAKGNW